MFKSPNQQQMFHSNYWKRCVKMLLLFWNNKPERVYATPIATQLHLLSPEDGASLLSNNFDAECHLAVFVKRAPVAKFCNKKLTVKEIRNDVTLFQPATFKNKRSKGFTSIISFSMTWRRIGSTNKSKSNN